MTIEYDEKGKFYTDVVSKVSVPVTIQTTTHLVHGYMHVRRNLRVKDELDLDEKFLALTDVEVLGSDGQVLFRSPFMAVHRAHIIWVTPTEEQSAEKGS
ncbi:MAG TPA: hypothetical protein VNK49_11465 [Anaerolineales bacterium]|nr:hypothetical protein [Anaerolineales bacterium]